jgi:hypothetical protein
MSEWTNEQLTEIGDSIETELASRRLNGRLRAFTTMWVVRHGNDLFVRSAGGPDRPWYRHALDRGGGPIRAGGVEADVSFAQGTDAPNEAIDAAYHGKYYRFGPGPVGHVTGTESHDVTIQLVPDGGES